SGMLATGVGSVATGAGSGVDSGTGAGTTRFGFGFGATATGSGLGGGGSSVIVACSGVESGVKARSTGQKVSVRCRASDATSAMPNPTHDRFRHVLGRT